MLDKRVKSEGEWSLDSTLPFGPVGFVTNLLKPKLLQQTDWHNVKYLILTCLAEELIVLYKETRMNRTMNRTVRSKKFKLTSIWIEPLCLRLLVD